MISFESTAKTVKQAIEEGLQKAGKQLDEVDVKIISQGGFLRKAKVMITVLSPESEAREKESARQEPNENSGGKSAASRDKKPEYRRHESPVEVQKQEKPAVRPEKRETEASKDAAPKETAFKQYNKESSSPKHDIKDTKPEIQPQKKEFNKTKGFDGKESFDGREKRGFAKDESRSGFNKNKSGEGANKKDVGANKSGSNRNENGSGASKSGFGKNDSKFGGDGSESNSLERKQSPREGKYEEREPRKEREYADMTEELAASAYGFVEGVLTRMQIPFSALRKLEDGGLHIDITSDSGALIGYRGETLDAIEYLASVSINKTEGKYYKLTLDCNNYRVKRSETLKSIAYKLAEKAVKTRRKVIMEPMSSFSRKVIHSALSENDKVITKSEGKEPNRHIIIIPKR